MDVKAEVESMEAGLREKGLTVADVLRDTGVAASTWQRWKTSGQVPLLDTWEKVQGAYKLRVRRK
jgi:hypothetical protein